MGSKGKRDDLARASSSAGASGGDGGGGGGGAAPPSPPWIPLSPAWSPLAPAPASPSRGPGALAASPRPLQPPGSPPRLADQDTDEGADDDYLLEEEDDDGFNWEQEEAEHKSLMMEGELKDDADSGEQEGAVGHDTGFFCILLMSDRRNVPDAIIRDRFLPLNKHAYFSLHPFWSWLLDGSRSYLRPPNDHRMVNGGFWSGPYDYQRALGFQEPITELIRESSDNYIIQGKITILGKQYGFFRRTRSDGSCFYRALLFSYLENLGQMQDRQTEVKRLMECVEVSKKRFYGLKWDKAYFFSRWTNPEEYFLTIAHEFYLLVNSVANGMTSDRLYEKSIEEMSLGRIISFLRLLTEIEIGTQGIYKPFIPEDRTLQFCWKTVRGLYAEAQVVHMRALTYALGIPLRVEIVNRKKSRDQGVKVRRLDFFHQYDLSKGPVHLGQSYYSMDAAHKPVVRGSDDDLLSTDGAPLLTLLCRPGHCDILYAK